jgi:hypothetical protein
MTSSFYRGPIVLFGFMLPAVAAGAIICLSYLGKTRMSESLEAKIQHYKGYEQTRQAAIAVEKDLAWQRPHLARWKSEMAAGTASSASAALKDITERLPPSEIQQTAFDPGLGSGGFGAVTANKSSQVRIAFRGTYRSVQKAFLDLEARLPQLQLQELRINPGGGTQSLLNYQVTYTAWEQ